MLAKRLITAILLLSLTFLLVTINNLLVLKSFIFLIHLIVLWEWLGLLKKSFFYKSLPLSIFFLCSLIASEENNFELFETVVINASVLFWIILVPIILFRRKSFYGVLALYFAVVMTLASFYASLWALDKGLMFILSILLVVWIADTFAFISGRFFGRRKLAPHISPKKTVEGVYGALIANLFLSFFFIEFEFGWFNEVRQTTNILSVFILVMLATFISIIGDLFQSLLKREAKVKDSGKLLPGHGGFYDRFDAVIAVCPFLVFSVKLIQ